MEKLIVTKEQIEIDSQGRVIINNEELKKRAENFLNSDSNAIGHGSDPGWWDNTNCGGCTPGKGA